MHSPPASLIDILAAVDRGNESVFQDGSMRRKFTIILDCAKLPKVDLDWGGER